jgi:hypothetical protein
MPDSTGLIPHKEKITWSQDKNSASTVAAIRSQLSLNCPFMAKNKETAITHLLSTPIFGPTLELICHIPISYTTVRHAHN